jgi:hypothetical protein
MIDRLGIIPAAGKATRFGGVLKEMLPLDEHTALIDTAYNSFKYCGSVLVVTSLTKLVTLAAHLPDCTFRIQQDGKDMWGAIAETLELSGKRNLFAMPDTYFNHDCWGRELADDFTLGLFNTDKPERFGMLRGNKIVDKQPGAAGKAWGVLAWSDRVAEYWFENFNSIETSTQAFNMAMDKFGFSTFDLAYYYDCATMEAYKEILSYV